MAQTTMMVRLNETLSEFVRRDKERVERDAFDRLKAELAQAYAAPESAYKPLTATDVITRNRSCPGGDIRATSQLLRELRRNPEVVLHLLHDVLAAMRSLNLRPRPDTVSANLQSGMQTP